VVVGATRRRTANPVHHKVKRKKREKNWERESGPTFEIEGVSQRTGVSCTIDSRRTENELNHWGHGVRGGREGANHSAPGKRLMDLIMGGRLAQVNCVPDAIPGPENQKVGLNIPYPHGAIRVTNNVEPIRGRR